MRQTLEREIKLRADAGFALPDFPGEPLRERRFTSTYHDTRDMRLAAAGITLRHRREEGSGLWQLKLPHAQGRLELELIGNAKAPPPSMRDLIAGVIGRRALLPVATLETRRRGLRVLGGGVQLADVLIDEVTVAGDGAVLQRFEELEVELIDGDAEELGRIQQALREAGARDTEDRPKLFQALGLERSRPAAVPREASPLEHLAAMLVEQDREILTHDPGTRLGSDPEDLHQHRVAVRRLRALLRAAEPMLDRGWAEGLRRELRAVGGALGAVRDLDVLLGHLRNVGEELEIEGEEGFQRVTGVFEARRSHARAVMLDELRKPAYTLLLDRLERELPEPRASGQSVPLAEIAGDEHRALVKAMHRLGDDPKDAKLHAARIKVKHARYAAELAQGAVGKPASRYIAGAKRLQDILGDHQDATVARAELKGVARLLDDPEVTEVVKRLRRYENERKRASREAYPASWAELLDRGDAAWG